MLVSVPHDLSWLPGQGASLPTVKLNRGAVGQVVRF